MPLLSDVDVAKIAGQHGAEFARPSRHVERAHRERRRDRGHPGVGRPGLPVRNIRHTDTRQLIAVTIYRTIVDRENNIVFNNL